MTPTLEEVAALVQLLQRPYGNMTGSERTDTAAALTALQARAEAAEARVRELEAAAQPRQWLPLCECGMSGPCMMENCKSPILTSAALTPTPAESQ